MTLGELADVVRGSLEGDAGCVVHGIGRLDEAGPDDLSFCTLPKYRELVAATRAAAIIVGEDFELPAGSREDLGLIRVANPYLALAEAAGALFPQDVHDEGVHATAVLGSDCELAEGVSVGPRAVLGAGCVLGPGSRIGAGCVLAAGTRIGADCRLHANVSVYANVVIGDRVTVHSGAVLGADGFGYATAAGRHVKIPQIGGVVIEDDVEIGANACIDRASLGMTRIGQGAKIDNLVQIGHNCDVGENTLLCGQVGIGGSATLGKGVVMGGQSGLPDHMSVGDGAMVAAQAGIIGDVAAGERVAGYPHADASRWRRSMAALRSLPELVRRVRRLEATFERRGEDGE